MVINPALYETETLSPEVRLRLQNLVYVKCCCILTQGRDGSTPSRRGGNIEFSLILISLRVFRRRDQYFSHQGIREGIRAKKSAIILSVRGLPRIWLSILNCGDFVDLNLSSFDHYSSYWSICFGTLSF